MTSISVEGRLKSKELYKESAEDIQSCFKLAMRQLAASVHVITTEHNGRLYGMTATAVQSVSFDPMSMLCCVNKSASLHDMLIESGRFCINLLQTGQENISNNFSGKLQGEARFNEGEWLQTDDGLPYLNTAQANFFCLTDATLEYGTHTIFIGKVVDVKISENISPLLYLNGDYRK